MKYGSGPKRRTPLKRTGIRRKALASTYERTDRYTEGREVWVEATRSHPCCVCGATYNLHGHHILEKQWLKQAARTLGLDVVDLLWDLRNHLTVCERCHSRHHTGTARIRRQILRLYAPKVFDMATELNLTFRLVRTYPEDS